MDFVMDPAKEWYSEHYYFADSVPKMAPYWAHSTGSLTDER